MSIVIGAARRWLKTIPLQPLYFHNTNFKTIPVPQRLEEEFYGISTGLYYPTRISEVLNTKYQVVGKLGFGRDSTVWLANDLQ